MWGSGAEGSVGDFRLEECGELAQRLLPAEVTGLDGNEIGDVLLNHRHLGSDGNGLQRDGHFHLARKVRVIEHVAVDEQFARDKFQIGAAEGMALPGGEVPEGHSVPAAFPGLKLVDRTGETEGWQPARNGVGFQECAVDLFRPGGEDPVQFDSIRSEEHTSELQSLMRISYAVFCLKKKRKTQITQA